MGFVDTAIIVVISGNGGNTVSGVFGKRKFNRRTFISYGGSGGDVWLITDKQISTLNYFCLHRKFSAEHGQNGYRYGCRGRVGKSVFIRVPLGTRVYDKNTCILLSDLVHDQQKLILAKGGVHGVVNDRRRNDRKSGFFDKQSYRYCKRVFCGDIGKKRSIRLELLLLADVGVLGLPNTGKSTFVRCVSSAKTRVGDYPFSTLVPSLGVVYVGNDNFVIVDIPGIINGANFGSGLGFSFLKHLQRCRVLLHFIDFSLVENFKVLKNIEIVVDELRSYSQELAIKPVWLIFNKIDLLDTDHAKRKVSELIHALKWKERYYLISSKYNYGIVKLCYDLVKFIKPVQL